MTAGPPRGGSSPPRTSFLRHLDRAEEYFGVALLVALGILLSAQVFMRFVLGLAEALNRPTVAREQAFEKRTKDGPVDANGLAVMVETARCAIALSTHPVATSEKCYELMLKNAGARTPDALGVAQELPIRGWEEEKERLCARLVAKGIGASELTQTVRLAQVRIQNAEIPSVAAHTYSALFAQQMAARAQLEQMRRGLPAGPSGQQMPGIPEPGRGTGQYL